MVSSTSQEFINRLEQTLPPLALRSQVYAITGGLISNKSVASADNLGTGPSQKVRFGSRVAYPKESLIEWINGKITEGE